MVAKTEIINMGLRRLGAQRIDDISDNTPRAIIMNDIYNMCRDYVLSQGQWTFAKKRVSLAREVTGPLFEWTYQYTLPSDYIQASYELNDYEYKIENGKILSNDTILKFVYIFRQTLEGQFSPSFNIALSLYLAIIGCYPITQSNALKAELKKEFEDALNEARAVDSQSETPTEFDIDETFIDVR